MYIWIGLVFNKKDEDYIRNICKKINIDYKLNELSFTLPQHISLKTSFMTNNYNEVKEFIKDILKKQVPFKIKIQGINKINNGVIWLDIEETKQLRDIHNLLNSKLEEKYNIPLKNFDGDLFHFHSTLFQDTCICDEHQELVNKLKDNLKIPITTYINEIYLGVSEIGTVGTYKVTDTILLQQKNTNI